MVKKYVVVTVVVIAAALLLQVDLADGKEEELSYLNEWAVEIEADLNHARSVAERNGFELLRQDVLQVTSRKRQTGQDYKAVISQGLNDIVKTLETMTPKLPKVDQYLILGKKRDELGQGPEEPEENEERVTPIPLDQYVILGKKRDELGLGPEEPDEDKE